jgi:hypothetical protein
MRQCSPEPVAAAAARSRPWLRNWRLGRMCLLLSGGFQAPRHRHRRPSPCRRHHQLQWRPRLRRLQSRRFRPALRRGHLRPAVRPSRRRRRSVTGFSSRSARRATTSCGAFRPFSVARSRMAIRARSSTARSPSFSRGSRRRSSARRPNRERRRLSVPGRIVRSRAAGSPRVTQRATSSDRHGGTMEANAPSSARMDADAPSAPSWSSITSGPTRWEVRPPPRTSRCAAGATINTRPSWSSVLAPGASRATPEFLPRSVAPRRQANRVDRSRLRPRGRCPRQPLEVPHQ